MSSLLEQVAGKLWILNMLANEPVDQKSFFDAWKESMTYNSNDGDQPKMLGSSNKNDNMTNTGIEKWTESWNTEMTSEDAREVGDHVWRYILGDWSKVRQNKVLIAILRAACIAVLTWGFIDSILDSLTVVGAWIWTSLTLPRHLISSSSTTNLLMNWNTMWQTTKRHM